ncbi:MAG: dTDP-4-dehydrorhamnose 3,5-epimerase family protein [Proteobacteria bacterium]|nr:dTDP-4-dehydrorhamnose 3,5-epimerase family protein [Pseudomonadota bacterium]
MIEGVEIIKLTTFNDERGFFRELLRCNNPEFQENVTQISHSLVYQGVIKAWHAHKSQWQLNYVLNGLISVSLFDMRENSKTYKQIMTFLCGDNQSPIVYKFPPGVAHGYKCINGPMNIVYFTSGVYDIEEEIRIPYDDSFIGFDWLKTNIY